MLLTDSQQLRLLEELSPSTETKIEAAMKRCGVDKIPGEIERLREENKKLHEQTQNTFSSFKKSWSNIFRHAGSEIDKQ